MSDLKYSVASCVLEEKHVLFVLLIPKFWNKCFQMTQKGKWERVFKLVLATINIFKLVGLKFEVDNFLNKIFINHAKIRIHSDFIKLIRIYRLKYLL